MNKIKYLFFVLIAGVAFSSCLDDNTEDYSVWKGQNDAFFESVLTDSIDDNGNALYTKIYSGSYPDLYILLRELDAPEEGAKEIFYSSEVNIAYQGWLYNDPENPFDSSVSYTGRVSTFVPGFTLALQHMKEGSSCRVIIPQSLGYGYSYQGTIPPYSTLIFDLKVKEVTKQEY